MQMQIQMQMQIKGKQMMQPRNNSSQFNLKQCLIVVNNKMYFLDIIRVNKWTFRNMIAVK